MSSTQVCCLVPIKSLSMAFMKFSFKLRKIVTRNFSPITHLTYWWRWCWQNSHHCRIVLLVFFEEQNSTFYCWIFFISHKQKKALHSFNSVNKMKRTSFTFLSQKNLPPPLKTFIQLQSMLPASPPPSWQIKTLLVVEVVVINEKSNKISLLLQIWPRARCTLGKMKPFE